MQLFRNKYFAFYAILCFFAFAFQLFYPHHLLDTLEYVKHGNLLRENWLDFPNLIERFLEPLRRTPLYPVILRITDNKFIVVGVIQLMAALFIPFFLKEVLHKINRTKYLNLALVILCTYPLQMMYVGFKMPELLVEFLVFVFLWDVFSNKLKYAGIIVSLLVLLKPIFILFILLPFFARLLKIKKIHWMDFLPIACVFIVSFIHYQQYQIFSYSSISTTNIYEYNRYVVLSKTMGESQTYSLYSIESKHLESLRNMKEIKQFMDSANRQTLKSNIVPVGLLHIKGALIALVDPGRYDAMVFFDWDKTNGFLNVNSGLKEKGLPWFQWIYIVFFAVLNGLKLLLFFGGCFSLLKKREFVLIVIAIGMYLTVLGPVGSARYIVPIYPLLLVFMIQGFIKLTNIIKRENTAAE